MIADGILEEPKINVEGVLYYSAKEFKKAVAIYRKIVKVEFFTIGQLVTELKSNAFKINSMIENGYIKEPSVDIDGVLHYSAKEFTAAQAAYHKTCENVYSMFDVQRQGFTIDRIKALLELEMLPPLDIKIGKREFWSSKQIKSVVKILSTAHIPASNKAISNHEKRREDGWYSKTDVATLCGVARIAIDHHIKKGRIDKPTKRLVSFPGFFYNKKEVAKITKFMASIKSDKFKRGSR